MIDEDILKLVIARLETMPSYIEVNMGDSGTLGKEKLLDHVKKQDTIGKQIIDMQMAYLRALKVGI